MRDRRAAELDPSRNRYCAAAHAIVFPPAEDRPAKSPAVARAAAPLTRCTLRDSYRLDKREGGGYNQFLQAVVPDGHASPPGADQVIFREDDVRAADEEVEVPAVGK